MRLKIKVHLFERLLKFIEMVSSNYLLKENDEKSLVNFSLDFSRVLNKNDLNVSDYLKNKVIYVYLGCFDHENLLICINESDFKERNRR